MRAYRRKIFIKPVLNIENKTAGGLIILGGTDVLDQDNLGKVLSAGNGTKEEPMRYEVGDTVKYNPYAGVRHRLNGEEILIMEDTDVYCSISKGNLGGYD